MIKVLIVEDDPMARELMENFVRGSGRYEVSRSIKSAAFAETHCLQNPASSDFMKFVVSGGVSGLPSAQEIEVILEAKNIASDDKNKIV